MEDIQLSTLLWILGGACASLAIIFPLAFLVFIYKEAKLKRRATFVEENTIIAIVKGENGDLDHFFGNIENHGFSSSVHTTDWDLQEVAGAKFTEIPSWSWFKFRKHIWNWFGIYWVSILHPMRQLHSFEIDKKKLRVQLPSNEEGDNQDLDQYVVGGKEQVYGLRHKFPRPSVVHSVELAGDGSSIDVGLLGVFKVRNPHKPVFVYKGDFFPLLDQALAAALTNFCASHKEGGTHLLTYSSWMSLDKKADSPFEEAMLGINTRVQNTPTGMTPNAPMGIIDQFGIELVEIVVWGWGYDKQTRLVADARRAQEIARLKAEGAREEAYGVRDALTAVADGEAARYDRALGVFKTKGVNPNVAATQIGMIEQAAQLAKNTNMRTLVLGNNPGTVISINAENGDE